MIDETAELEIVEAYVNGRHRVLEGGTGEGTVTAAIAERAELVITCDPQPRGRSSVVRHANAAFYAAALTPTGESLPMHFRRDWWNTSASSVGGYEKKEHVRGVSAEALIRAFNINCLVLDIEGYELELLPRIDLSQIELLTFEYHPHLVPPDSDYYLFRHLEHAGFEEVERRQAHPEDDYPYPPPGLIAPVFRKVQP